MTTNFGDFDSSALNPLDFHTRIEIRDFEHFMITDIPTRYDTCCANDTHYTLDEKHAIDHATDVLRAFRNLWFKRFYVHAQDRFSNANPFQADFGRFRFYEAQIIAATHKKQLFQQKFEFASISAVPHEGKLDHTQFYPLALLREHILHELAQVKSLAGCEVNITCTAMAPDNWYIDWLDAYVEKFNKMMRDYESYISECIDRTYGWAFDPEDPRIKCIDKQPVLLRYYKMGERSQFEEIQVEDFGVKPINRYVIAASDFLDFTHHTSDDDWCDDGSDYVPSDDSESDDTSCDSMSEGDDICEPETKRVM